MWIKAAMGHCALHHKEKLGSDDPQVPPTVWNSENTNIDSKNTEIALEDNMVVSFQVDLVPTSFSL